MNNRIVPTAIARRVFTKKFPSSSIGEGGTLELGITTARKLEHGYVLSQLRDFSGIMQGGRTVRDSPFMQQVWIPNARGTYRSMA